MTAILNIYGYGYGRWQRKSSPAECDRKITRGRGGTLLGIQDRGAVSASSWSRAWGWLHTTHNTAAEKWAEIHCPNTPRLASGGNAKCHCEDLNLDSRLTFQRTFFITDQTNYLLQLFICFLCLGEIVKLRKLMTTGSVIIIIKLSASYFRFHRVSMFHVREELWRKGGDEENGVSLVLEQGPSEGS